jgi:hypothetical protein
MEECANEITRERVNMRWPGNRATQDLFVDSEGVIVEEGLQGKASMC